MRAVMALSGGMDSTGLLMRLLADGYKVSCISYEYGQKHNIELERAKANIAYLASKDSRLNIESLIYHLLWDYSIPHLQAMKSMYQRAIMKKKR